MDEIELLKKEVKHLTELVGLQKQNLTFVDRQYQLITQQMTNFINLNTAGGDIHRRHEREIQTLRNEFLKMMELQVKLLEEFKKQFGVEIEHTLTIVK